MYITLSEFLKHLKRNAYVKVFLNKDDKEPIIEGRVNKVLKNPKLSNYKRDKIVEMYFIHSEFHLYLLLDF